jgi:hypothetical protein
MTPFESTYDRYRLATQRHLTGIGDRAEADALERQDELDAAWDRLSRAMPPVGVIGRVTRRPHFFLHAVARQAVWPDEADA